MNRRRSVVGAPAEAAPASSSPPVLDALTGIRAVGALAVLAFHLRDQILELLPALNPLVAFFHAGALGLDVFFVLSGFIISYNYAERLRDPDRPRYASFMIARFARIYPVHLAALLLTATLVGAAAVMGRTLDPTQDHSAASFLGNVFMLQALPGVHAWNGPAWSISCEWAAYLLFPFAAGLLLRLTRWQALGLAAVVVAAQLTMHAAIGPLSYPPVADRWTRIAGEFTLGCLLWAAWRYGVRAHWRWDVVGLLSLGGVALVTTWAGSTGVNLIIEPIYVMVSLPFLGLFVVAMASATGPLHKVMSCRPMEWGGRLSYSFYLTHMPVLTVMMVLVSPRETASAPLAVRLLVLTSYLAAVLAGAAFTYYLVEEPGRRWIRRRVARRDQARAGVVADRASVTRAAPAVPVASDGEALTASGRTPRA